MPASSVEISAAPARSYPPETARAVWTGASAVAMKSMMLVKITQDM